MMIGHVEVKNNVFLAPLAGVSDRPFRLLCSEQGAGLVYTEMVSAKAISYDNKKTEQLLVVSPEKEKVGIQLFGRDPDILASSAQKIDHEGIALFDINMGCPVYKIVNNGEGSALMKEPKLIEAIVKAMVKAVDKPVTIKIRSGFDADSVNAVEVAKIAEAAGVAAIGIHGRTREQYYSGQADWEVIRQVKEAVKIPVFGNGDIFSAKDGKAMLDQTGCDAILIARGAQGNPWIFREVLHYLATGELLERPSPEEIVAMIVRHKDLMIEEKGDYVALREMRKHVSWYSKGMKHSTILRKEINMLEDMDRFDAMIHEILMKQ